MDEEELFTDSDIKLIDDAVKYKMRWLTKYINKHDKFGGAEDAKRKRSELAALRWKIRQDAKARVS